MKDINLVKLKELAARLLNPTDRFSEVSDKFEWKAVASPAVISALIEQLEAAQRKGNEAVLLRIKESSALSVATARYEKAKAEIKRRDDAKPFAFGISDPDGEAYFDEFCIASDPGCLEDYVHALNDQLEDGMQKFTVVPLYAAAPAALLPQEKSRISENGVPLALNDYDTGWNECLTAAIILGCQPEKVVKLPFKATTSNVPFAANGWNAAVDECIKALDAAGVKWVEEE